MTSWPISAINHHNCPTICRTLAFHLFLPVWPFIIWSITNWGSSSLIDNKLKNIFHDRSLIEMHLLACKLPEAEKSVWSCQSASSARDLYKVTIGKAIIGEHGCSIHHMIILFFHLHWYSMTCGKEFPVDNGNKRHRKNALADRTVPCIGTMMIMMRMIAVVGDYT